MSDTPIWDQKRLRLGQNTTKWYIGKCGNRWLLDPPHNTGFWISGHDSWVDAVAYFQRLSGSAVLQDKADRYRER